MQNFKNFLPGITFVLLLCLLFYIFYRVVYRSGPASDTNAPVAAASSTPLFTYEFDSEGTLAEAENAEHSTSPYWWLDSGGLFTISGGEGHTAEGDLAENNYWHTEYNHTNPDDTDQGTHPQNIFRLITRSTWHNFTQEAYFKIDAYHLSQSPQRGESNGLLLLSRYENEENLYYAGIRVDGTAVIKKKLNGTYYTLKQTQVIPGVFDQDKNPNLLPLHKWIGLRSTITTDSSGTVHIVLYTDMDQTGNWKKVLETTDANTGVPVIDNRAYAGIRTDFMDVSFDHYQTQEM